jgi:hypothetical protein
MEVSATSAPALAAEPVISSASHGRAINTIEPAITPVMLESSTKMYGAKRLWVFN